MLWKIWYLSNVLMGVKNGIYRCGFNYIYDRDEVIKILSLEVFRIMS